MPFIFTDFDIPGVILIEAQAVEDRRGFFAETYKHSEFAEHCISESFVQDNWSHSVHGVLRGLHYQKHPAAQSKLVSVIRGEIFDVAVDIRKDSPSYGRWVGVILSASSHRLLYVSDGFAHGFCVLSPEADVLYKVTAEYSAENERGILWSDPQLAINWPVKAPMVSPRDAALPLLRDADNDFI